MAIIKHTDKNNETLWKAYISIRSKLDPAIRVQKWKFGIKSDKQAKREEENLRRECLTEILKRDAEGSSWGVLVDKWHDYQVSERSGELNPLTCGDYVAAIKKYTLSWWTRSAASITRMDVMEVLNQMDALGSSVSYRHKIKVIIHRVFTFGIEHQLVRGISQTPAHGISLKRDEEKKPEILSIDEIRKLLHASKTMKHEWHHVWALALLTGMRNGELFALKWKDVDFLNREINVEWSYNCRIKAIKSTKGGYWRTVPVSDELLALLNELKEKTGATDFVLPRVARWANGEQAKNLRAFCKSVGLPSIKFHTLRACFATQLIRNGIPPIQIQKICGWKDLETMQRYVRLAGIEIKGATESLKLLPNIVLQTTEATLQELSEQLKVPSDKKKQEAA